MRLHPVSFNGKEKDHESGFHYYGARYYWSEVLTGWLSVDPMADKYPNISPYAYCVWNPIKLVDPNGMDIWELNKNGELIWKERSEKDIIRSSNGKEVEVGNGILTRGESYTKANNKYMSLMFGDNMENATEVFEFLSDNTEDIVFCLTGIAASKYDEKPSFYVVSTSFDPKGDHYTSQFVERQVKKGKLRFFYHNHPSGELGPSNSSNAAGDGLDDITVAGVRFWENALDVQYICEFKIYCSNIQGGRLGIYRLFGAKNNTGNINLSSVNKRGRQYKYE